MRRGCDLSLLDLRYIKWSTDGTQVEFQLNGMSKCLNSRSTPAQRKAFQSFTLKQLPVDQSQPNDIKICPVRTLWHYLHRSKPLRET